MQWEMHGIRKIGSSYWLASREYIKTGYPYNNGQEDFCIRIVDSYGYNSYASKITFKISKFINAYSNTFGVRPVITLEPNIITTGKTGNAYNIEPYVHVHVGNSSTKGGCYTTPVYHQHSGDNGYSTSSSKALKNASGCYANAKYVTSKWVHKNCSCGATSAANGGCGYGNADTYYYVENYTCGKTTSTVEKYKLSCGYE